MGGKRSRTAKPATEQYELDTSEPLLERQVELRNAHAKNVKRGKPPYADVEFWSLGELQWVIRENRWSGEPLKFSGVRVDLRHAGLSGINFSGVRLDRADLSGANLGMANLTGASLYDANLSGTILQQANLSGANLKAVKLSNETNLEMVIFDNHTRMVDIDWNGVKLTQVDWELMDRLGDDYYADLRHSTQGVRLDTSARLWRYQDAARANRQLALVLREQGLNGYADRFNFRAQVMERKAAWREIWIPSRTWDTPFPWTVNKPRTIRWRGQKAAGYLIMLLLEIMAGYGYRLWRIAAAYGLVLLAFAVIFLSLGVHSHSGEPGIQAFWDSLLVSLSAIHGRTFFEQVGAWSPDAWVAAIESVFGIVIEGIFVAMLIQRFFSR